jgi:hypothetical protein
MLVESDLPVLKGDELIVTFKSPVDDRWFDCTATVTRVARGRRRNDARPAVGIAFGAMDPWTEIVLCDHLRHALPVRAHGRLHVTRRWS